MKLPKSERPMIKAAHTSFRHIFGPVPSRRLGVSLGIDLVPHKYCSLNCVYCECGKTTNLTVDRKEYISCDEIIRELDQYMQLNPAPDYITFSGAGEPTLNSRIGDVISYIKKQYPDVPLAVLTNGTLLADPDRGTALMPADLLIPSLDAATPETFLRINRPHPSLSLDRHIEGLLAFSKVFPGQIWLEVFILPGYNDHKEELDALKTVIADIRPRRIQLNTLDRPGTLPGLRPASKELLEDIVRDWAFPGLEIIAPVSIRKSIVAFRDEIGQILYNTLARRPCTAEDLSRVLHLHINEINKYLDVLESEGKIESCIMKRGSFYRLKPGPGNVVINGGIEIKEIKINKEKR